MDSRPIRIEVNHRDGSYDYFVGHDLLGSYRELAAVDGPTAIVTTEADGSRYLDCLDLADVVIVVPSGRHTKTMAIVETVHRRLLDARLDRSATLVSVGDSIVGDVTAFAAATYLRGIDVVHVPTELIAMIDTSVGGKVGLDVPHGRNLIGLFKQPKAVIADVVTLQSLPPAVFTAGMSEVVKHALITSEDMTRRIESSAWDSAQWTSDGSVTELVELVAHAVQVKVDIVAEDPLDEARRQVLNLGHTFAYAFESATFGDISHGEAVGVGLISASCLSAELGLCDEELHHRVRRLVDHIGQRTRLPRAVAIEDVERAFAHDKKRRGPEQRFVLLEGIGAPVVRNVTNRAAVLNAIESVQP